MRLLGVINIYRTLPKTLMIVFKSRTCHLRTNQYIPVGDKFISGSALRLSGAVRPQP
jgi:hypothetical protein